MPLIKGDSVKKATSKAKGAANELTPADGWLKLKVVRSDRSEFPLRKDMPMYLTDGGDRVLEALIHAETKYRDKCLAEGVPYVPRVIKFEGTINLVQPQAELPDLFE